MGYLWFQVQLSSILSQGEATLCSLVQRGQELAARLRALQVDRREIACLKFLLLFNPSESSSPHVFFHHHTRSTKKPPELLYPSFDFLQWLTFVFQVKYCKKERHFMQPTALTKCLLFSALAKDVLWKAQTMCWVSDVCLEEWLMQKSINLLELHGHTCLRIWIAALTSWWKKCYNCW